MTAELFDPERVPGPETARDFRDALGRFATGVTLVTTEGPQGPLGFTANSFASVSLDPALVLWSPARSASRFPAFAAARHYAIHILGVDQFARIADFGRGGPGFGDSQPLRNAEGVPLIPGALARFDCEQHATHDGGDHLIIVGRVLRFTLREGAPLVFSQGAWGGFAHGG
ncbi:flavin reductase [Gemmobacter lutimaris]|uniref:Flavin reductase n=1 Tax=Gemmobacter lutimaris TaxID=2306023 RepID=A0A398BTV6_9RHOB|nr:flavin reductase family protein [Gemmobacter lutimaris]RID90723.1 flavin reductase [Gemmobacter lutimaris]